MTSPGASSVPAKSEPIITELAPAARALTTSPEYLMPPSEMTGTSRHRRRGRSRRPPSAAGTPTPATTRVVQMLPGPIPTLTASTPASMSARVPSAVATLPAMSSKPVAALRVSRTASSTPPEWPCAVSTTMTSHPARRQRLDAGLAGPRPRRRRRRTRRRPLRVLGGVGVGLGLLDVLDGDQAPELALDVDDEAASRCGSGAAAPWPRSC